jgi:hypothetical protein
VIRSPRTSAGVVPERGDAHDVQHGRTDAAAPTMGGRGEPVAAFGVVVGERLDDGSSGIIHGRYVPAAGTSQHFLGRPTLRPMPSRLLQWRWPGLDGDAAPVLGRAISDGLGERPVVPGQVDGDVLPLAEREVVRCADDASAGGLGGSAVGVDVVHPHHCGVGERRIVSGRTPPVRRVGDDDRAFVEGELGSMVIDPDVLHETENGRQPAHRCGNIRIGQNRND